MNSALKMYFSVHGDTKWSLRGDKRPESSQFNINFNTGFVLSFNKYNHVEIIRSFSITGSHLIPRRD
jgi:hypothetical protein